MQTDAQIIAAEQAEQVRRTTVATEAVEADHLDQVIHRIRAQLRELRLQQRRADRLEALSVRLEQDIAEYRRALSRKGGQ